MTTSESALSYPPGFDPERMTYAAEKPPLRETSEQLRARIPGWGVDLDPADRPSYPKLVLQEDRSGVSGTGGFSAA